MVIIVICLICKIKFFRTEEFNDILLVFSEYKSIVNQDKGDEFDILFNIKCLYFNDLL